MSNLRSKLVTTAANAAAAVGGAGIANAATSTPSTSTAAAGMTAAATAPGQHAGRHSVDGKTEQALTGTTAAKVEAAALAKVAGTVDRLETNVDGSAPYEAHITKADGSQVEVQISKSFTVVATNDMPGHP